MCKFHLLGTCAKGSQCNFAHDPVEIQKLPDLRFTKVCKTLIETGQCKNRSCTYAHSKEEFRPKGAFHKTRFCRFIKTGYCTLGNACNFAHTQDELRDPERLDGTARSHAAALAQMSFPVAERSSASSDCRDSNEKLAAALVPGKIKDRPSLEFSTSYNEPAYVRVPWKGATQTHLDKSRFTTSEREACANLAYATAFADHGGSWSGYDYANANPLHGGWHLRDMAIDQEDEWKARECSVFSSTMPGMRAVRTSESTLCTLGDSGQI
jgi:hypothetical protein